MLAALLLPRAKNLQHGDGALVRWLKQRDEQLLHWSFRHHRPLFAGLALLVIGAALIVPQLPRSFLPPFNEGTLTINLLMKPGISLAESDQLGRRAEQTLLHIPEIKTVGRRTGRAEMDEHAEGVHYSEIDVDLQVSARERSAVIADIRAALAPFPASVSIGQPISHRLDHLLSGVRAAIAVKVFGDDLSQLRSIAGEVQQQLAGIPGIVDLGVEPHVPVPQLVVDIDYSKAAQYGVTPASIQQLLTEALGGAQTSEIIDGNRRYAVVVRLSDDDRRPDKLAQLRIATATGDVPLSALARISEIDGPNQIGREQSQRRLIISANVADRSLSDVIADVRQQLDVLPLPPGYQLRLEGQFQAQEQATRLISALALISALLIALVLYSRYQSWRLTALVMANIPMALVGSVVALWLADQPLSVASLIGFITLAGISARNGILKISHYINLARQENLPFGTALVVRGSLERLTPVLMTALTAAFALLPLVLSAGEPGKEILHPVAVVIFGGLISATLLDTLITPLAFLHIGRVPLERLRAQIRDDVF